MSTLFKEASYLLDKIEEGGYKAFFVGGCVRDYWLNKPIKDIDIASSAKPEEIQKIFPKTIPVGIEHGTVIVRHNHVSYEVTTFRKEDKYEDFRRPSKVWFVTEIEEDLARRDFTFNAMAMNKSLDIFDPFQGKEDLEKMQIRTVGDPDKRFFEDPLRLMRACRFMSTYHFMIEEETKLAVEKNANLLKRISIERIADEFEKLLAGESVKDALIFMKKSKLFHYLPYPLTEKKEGSILSLDWNRISLTEQRWAAVVLLTAAGDYREILKNWKLSNDKIHRILAILSACHVNEWTKMDLYRVGLENALLGVQLKCAILQKPFEMHAEKLTKMFREILITSRKDIPVNGEDLIRLKERAPGEWVGDLLNDLEYEIVQNHLSLSKEVIMEWVRKWEKR
jgi:tRNA nucleotidyltransferase (CCA-adding enzyme)